MTGPRRIICLTEETVETLYLLGEQDRIVGISGYAVRPPAARREQSGGLQELALDASAQQRGGPP